MAAASLLAAIIVVDGDTVDFEGKRYRLQDFDAPEIGNALCEGERQKGIQAAEFLRELIGTRRAELRPANRKEKWKRELGRLLIDGENVAHIMVREGLGKYWNGRGPKPEWCE